MQLLMNQDRISQVIGELSRRVAGDKLLLGLEQPLALVGIRSRGEPLAQRMAAEIAQLRETDGSGGGGRGKIDVGALDITMYRDDVSSRHGRIAIPQGTEMNFRLDDRAVILIDDVIETGRSVRAALDALVDFGRPRLIRLAVLIDRGRREFPIAADYVGLRVDDTDPQQKIVVRLRPTDDEDAAYLTRDARSRKHSAGKARRQA